MDAEAPPLDPSRVAALRALAGPDMPELADEVARIFVEAAADGWKKLEAAAERADLPAVLHEAHALKGSSGNVGAMPLAALCGEIERLARAEARISDEHVALVGPELGRVLAAMASEFDLAA